MRISENWLREWVNPSIDIEQLAHTLTMAGLEVDAVEPAAAKFSGVVVAKVISITEHPDAKKLRLCSVDDDSGRVAQVICGASNVREGLTVAFAKVGAVLANDYRIEAKELRGVKSYGMICSAEELGLADSSQGILELPDNLELGRDLYNCLELDDLIIDLDLTPNRSDCLSVQGVAREVSALLNTEILKPFTVEPVKSVSKKTFPVKIQNPSDCPRYIGRVIEGVSGRVQSPIWMQERLRRSGIRSINAIADITNFVMLEMGQPMHAFDLNKLQGGIEVRFANKQESLELLDGQTIELSKDDLVIADEKHAIALAGIMGGSSTSVLEETVDIFLESASFNAQTIAGRARCYGLHTDSSHRFERSVDANLAHLAIERATQLIVELVGGKAGPVICQEDNSQFKGPRKIKLPIEKVKSLLGISITIDEMQDYLTRLNCKAKKQNSKLLVEPPSYRFDLEIDVDLIEEIARLVGYENIPSTLKASTSDISLDISDNKLEFMKQTLKFRGYHEVISFSFVDRDLELILNPDHAAKALSNPISQELAVMRSSIWPGLIKAAEYNLNRQQSRIRFFEYGLQYLQTNSGLKQIPNLSGLVCGPCESEQWGIDNRNVDFFDVKGDVERLLENALPAESKIEYMPLKDSALHPGQAAEILLNAKNKLGRLGKLHPGIQSALGINHSIFLFELNLTAVLGNKHKTEFKALSKYPSIRRDITLIVDESVNAGEICANIEQMEISFLKNIIIFSVYKGRGIPESKKSISLGLILQEFSRTLTDKEIEQTLSSIISQLKDRVGAEIKN